MSSRQLRSITLFVLTVLLPGVADAKVEAIRNKRYELDRRNGPWMIMVAALRDVPASRRDNGMSAWQAADQLVYELRRMGVPAFTYLMGEKREIVGPGSVELVKHTDRHYIAQHESIAVLAGNFRTPDDRKAQQVLKYLKEEYEPQFIRDKKNGGLFRVTPGRPKPFSGAFMTTNPLVDRKEVVKHTPDPLIRRLNSGQDYSLLENKGRYSLKVATFSGSNVVQMGNNRDEKAIKLFDKLIGTNLDKSAQNAWELAQALRQASRYGYARDIEAYVFHDRNNSYVTIGSFTSKTDPRIAHLKKQFGSKSTVYQGKDVMTAELFSIPRNPGQGVAPERFWLFDIEPKLVEVPQGY